MNPNFSPVEHPTRYEAGRSKPSCRTRTAACCIDMTQPNTPTYLKIQTRSA